MTYKGYQIKMDVNCMANRSTAYKIFKDGQRVSEMHLASIRVGQYLVDRFLIKPKRKKNAA